MTHPSRPALITLMGREDRPTDAIQDYCLLLKQRLDPLGWNLQVHHFEWHSQGWRSSLARLERAIRQSSGWILLQYTALQWSRRGFPLALAWLLNRLSRPPFQAFRIGIVYHDVVPYEALSALGHVRRRVQILVMRRALARSNLCVLTVRPERVHWIPQVRPHMVFVPVGPGIPPSDRVHPPPEGPRQVVVFGVTGGRRLHPEVEAVTAAVRRASGSVPLRLIVCGRGSEQAHPLFTRMLEDSGVELVVLGIQRAPQIAAVLSAGDAMLFVRGEISTRRSSAVSAIASGLPVVAYRGAETASPITEAGVMLVDPADPAGLGEALTRVLTDDQLNRRLRALNREAFRAHFSWEAIARRYDHFLRSAPAPHG